MGDNANVGKIIALVLIVGVLLFVAFGEFSDSLSGAVFVKNYGYRPGSCSDTDISDNVNVRGELTTQKILSYQTQSYETIKKVDECISPNSKRVRQWSCLKDKPKAIDSKYCMGRTVCRDGACV